MEGFFRRGQRGVPTLDTGRSIWVARVRVLSAPIVRRPRSPPCFKIDTVGQHPLGTLDVHGRSVNSRAIPTSRRTYSAPRPALPDAAAWCSLSTTTPLVATSDRVAVGGGQRSSFGDLHRRARRAVFPAASANRVAVTSRRQRGRDQQPFSSARVHLGGGAAVPFDGGKRSFSTRLSFVCSDTPRRFTGPHTADNTVPCRVQHVDIGLDADQLRLWSPRGS